MIDILVLNYRHRNAQQASRSSVELYTHLFFKDKNVTEDAYVSKVLKNGICVLVPKYGIETIVHFSPPPTSKTASSTILEYDAEKGVLWIDCANGKFEFFMFKKVKVNIQCISTGGGQRSMLLCHVVEPAIGIQN